MDFPPKNFGLDGISQCIGPWSFTGIIRNFQISHFSCRKLARTLTKALKLSVDSKNHLLWFNCYVIPGPFHMFCRNPMVFQMPRYGLRCQRCSGEKAKYVERTLKDIELFAGEFNRNLSGRPPYHPRLCYKCVDDVGDTITECSICPRAYHKKCTSKPFAIFRGHYICPDFCQMEQKVVLAKCDGYPRWPARVISDTEREKKLVLFFGTHDLGNISSKKISDFTQENLRKVQVPPEFKEIFRVAEEKATIYVEYVCCFACIVPFTLVVAILPRVYTRDKYIDSFLHIHSCHALFMHIIVLKKIANDAISNSAYAK